MRSPFTSTIFSGSRERISPERARGGMARYLLVALLPLVLGPLITVAVLLFRQAQADLTRQATAQLNSLSTTKRSLVEQWMAAHVADVSNLADAGDVLSGVQAVVGLSSSMPIDLEARFEYFLANPRNSNYEGLLLVNMANDTVVVATTNYKHLLGQQPFADKDFYRQGQASAVAAFPPFDPVLDPDTINLFAAAPVVDPQQGPIAVLVGIVGARRLAVLIAPVPGLGTDSRAYMITSDGYELGVPVANQPAKPASRGIQLSLVDHNTGAEVYAAPSGQQVLGSYTWLSRQSLALLVEQDVQDAYAALSGATTIFADVMAVAAIISVLAVFFFTRALTGPIQNLSDGVLRMASGDLNTTVRIERTDEIGLLAQSFNTMVAQLRDLYRDLEGQVEHRTRQLATAAEVGRAASSILSIDELLRKTVDLVRDRFGYYHVSIFLLDEAKEYAILRESTGEVGARLKSRGHKLAVGLNSIIGWVTLNGQPRVSSEVGADPVHFRNELLPETRAEAAVPIKVGERILGALDVQSREANAFAAADINALQILADQIAVALENVRLFERQQRVMNLEHVVATLTAKIYQSPNIDVILDNAATELGRALSARKVVVRLAPPSALAQRKSAEPVPDNGNGRHGPEAEG